MGNSAVKLLEPFHKHSHAGMFSGTHVGEQRAAWTLERLARDAAIARHAPARDSLAAAITSNNQLEQDFLSAWFARTWARRSPWSNIESMYIYVCQGTLDNASFAVGVLGHD